MKNYRKDKQISQIKITSEKDIIIVQHPNNKKSKKLNDC